MSSTTQLPRIVWDRASPREKDLFLNILSKVAGDYIQIRCDPGPTDGAGTWLTVWRSKPYPPNSFVKIDVEASGVKIGDATEYADLNWRDSFFTSSTGVTGLSGGAYAWFNRTNVGYNVQTVANADRSFSIQVKDAGTWKMQWTVIHRLIEMRA